MIVYNIMAFSNAEVVIEKMFDIFDIDGNGKISKEEMKIVVKDLEILFQKDNDKKNHNDVFKQMDDNHDDFVDKTEFVEAIMKHNVYGQNLALKLSQLFNSFNQGN